MSSRIKTDWKLFTAISLILAFGLVMVYSASSVVAEVLYKKQTWEFAAKQLAFAVAGVILMMLLKTVDYKKLQHPLFVFLPVGVVGVLLLGVLFADPHAHRWYRAGGMQLQPSELAKPALILFLAWLVAQKESEKKINDRYTLLPTILVVGGLVLLIGVGDLGTAAIMLAPVAVIFFVAGLDKRYFLVTGIVAMLLLVVFLFQKPYRLLRVTAFVGITEEAIMKDARYDWLAKKIATSRASRDAAHQPRQAKLAAGSGGITGVGLGQSNQKLGFLPEAHTDFIFGVVGEEVGLVGCTMLLLGYLYIFWRGVRLYWLTPDIFGRYLALGCVTIICAQALLNMTVVLDMAPTKGIPLPLISSGGSALICTLLTLGLLMSVSDRAEA